MKKLLSILLATATVFSTTAFANPAAEPIESADEISIEVGGAISSKISDASLAEETASYYDPTLGVKIIDENFESFTVGETYGSAEVTHGNLKYATEGTGTTAELVKDVEGLEKGKYVRINIGDKAGWPSFKILLTNKDEYVNVPATFAVSSKLYVVGADFANGISAKPQMPIGNSKFKAASPTTLGTDSWQNLEKEIKQQSEGVAVQGLYWTFENSLKTSGTIYIDDIKLYYKPIATDNYNVIKPTYPTVTVNAPGGIEDNAVAALTAEPQKYFGSLVTSCKIDGETITLTVNNTGEITLPSVVNGTKTKTLNKLSVNVESIDELAPRCGIKVIDENFESFPVSEIYGSAEVPHGNLKYSTVGAGTTAELVENVEGVGEGKYVKIKIGGEANWPSFRILLAKQDEYVNVPATFTMSSKLYVVGDDFADGISAKPQMLLSPWAFKGAISTKLGTDSWQDLVKTITQQSEKHAARGLYWSFDNSSKAGTIYIDDIKLYYKPIAKDSYSDISFDFPTITVTAANGFEANAVAAMKANPAEYLSNAVKSVEFADNKMIITLNENEAVNHSSITIPALVNAAGSATYDEVTVNTAVAPTSLPEATSIRAKSPAGLRFKAAVKTEFMEEQSLTEFGYIVARAEKLTESGIADLTIGIDQTKLKTIVSPSFKKAEDGSITINKCEGGVDNTTFAAVLVNIPTTGYIEKFAVRPYVVYGGQYFYGETMKASINEIAQGIKDKGGLSADVLAVVDTILEGKALPEYNG